jgi:hypothetical protein
VLSQQQAPIGTARPTSPAKPHNPYTTAAATTTTAAAAAAGALEAPSKGGGGFGLNTEGSVTFKTSNASVLKAAGGILQQQQRRPTSPAKQIGAVRGLGSAGASVRSSLAASVDDYSHDFD